MIVVGIYKIFIYLFSLANEKLFKSKVRRLFLLEIYFERINNRDR